MKNVFIGLLIIAAGAGLYFFVFKKKKPSETVAINKELIIGKWQLASAEPLKDSALLKYRYDFQQGNLALVVKGDSVKADTARYEWNKTNELVVKENATDSIGKIYSVVKLTADSLQLHSATDSSKLLLIKAR